MRISDWSSDVCSSDLFGFFECSKFNRFGLRFRSLRIRHSGFRCSPDIFALFGCTSGRKVLLPLRSWRGIYHLSHLPSLLRCTIHESRKGCNAFVRRSKDGLVRSEEHTSELQSLMRISYAVFCLKQKTKYRLI